MSAPVNQPVNLFTNGSYWFCRQCGEENIVIASRHDVDMCDPSVRELVEHMFENGEFDDMIESEMAVDEDGDDGDPADPGDVMMFMPTGTLTLFREPQSVQCGSCHEVYPTHILSIEESYEARKWWDGDPAGE